MLCEVHNSQKLEYYVYCYGIKDEGTAFQVEAAVIVQSKSRRKPSPIRFGSWPESMTDAGVTLEFSRS